MDIDRTHNRQDLETAARIDTATEELKLQEKEIANAAAQASVKQALAQDHKDQLYPELLPRTQRLAPICLPALTDRRTYG
jgi:hypothetical protein